MSKGSLRIEDKKEFINDSIDLYMVSTALQLLNAIEAQYHFKTINNVIVLLLYGKNKRDSEQLFTYLELFPATKVIILDKGDQKSYINLNIALLKSINRYQYNNFFIGYFSANLRRLACNVSCNKLYLLDEGTYTIALHDELYNRESNTQFNLIKKYSEQARKTRLKKIKFFLYNSFRDFYFKIHRYKNDFKEINIGFLTVFKLKQYGNEEIITHSFPKLKMRYDSNVLMQKNNNYKPVYFLGQPLEKALELTEEEYISYINQIIYFYSKQRIDVIYIPHRGETKSTIDKIKKLASENFKILHLKKPFEMYMIEDNPNIYHVSSFFSSALFIVKKLSAELKVESFQIEFDEYRRDDIATIYNVLSQSEIKLLKLFREE